MTNLVLLLQKMLSCALFVIAYIYIYIKCNKNCFSFLVFLLLFHTWPFLSKRLILLPHFLDCDLVASSVVKSALKARLSAKHKAQSPWGFFPLKRSVLTKARFKRAFLSFFIKCKSLFFELFVNFFFKNPDLIFSH